jgi:hypothetical protein
MLLRAWGFIQDELPQDELSHDDIILKHHYDGIDKASNWPSSYHVLSTNKSIDEFRLESSGRWKTQMEVCNLNALWDTNVREEMPTYSNELGGTLVDDGPPRQNIWTDEIYAPSFT